MKQKFLSILPLLFFAAVIVNAQVATTYRGAFAPAPVAQWTDNWTNWNPQNTSYGIGLPVATKSGVITSSTLPATIAWVKDSVYLLTGPVYVDSLVTLTIEPGTVIKGDATFVISSLIVQRGAKLIANGTPCNPIVFTSSKAPGTRAAGDWGGITLLGRGLTNQGDNVNVEGIGATEPRARYGGSNNADNSGSLKYLRIEYAGYALTPGNELNSLTFGGVGSGTTIDYVQTSFGNDDAFEWFGGAVNCTHLIAYRTLDDDFDTDWGYSGIVQFALGIKDPNVSDVTATSTSEGFESDNNNFNSPVFGGNPVTSASFYNVTQIGAYRCANNLGGITNPTAPGNGHRRGARIRRNSQLKIFNSILMNNWKGLFIDGTASQANATAGTLQFRNNIVAMDFTFNSTVTGATGLATAGEDAFATTYLGNFANTNTIISTPCDVLVNAWDFLNPDYRPNAVGTGAALVGSDLTPGLNLETASFTDLVAKELVVDLFENGIGNSNGTITVTITVPSAFTVAVPGLTLSSTPQSGTNGTSANLGLPYTNGDWLFSLVGSNLIATSKPGVVITQGLSASLGYTIKRNTGVASGTNQNLAVGVSGGADTAPDNNNAVSGVSAL